MICIIVWLMVINLALYRMIVTCDMFRNTYSYLILYLLFNGADIVYRAH